MTDRLPNQEPHLTVDNDPPENDVLEPLRPFMERQAGRPYLFTNPYLGVWVSKQLDLDPNAYSSPYVFGLGIAKDGQFLGAALFHGGDYFAKTNILTLEASIATVHRSWANRRILRGLFTLPFVCMDAILLRTFAPRKSQEIRKFNQKLGFKYRGIYDGYYDGRKDAAVFAMKRDDCKWIR